MRRLRCAARAARGDGAAAPAFDPSSPPLAGDTLDVEPAAAAPADEDEAAPTPSPAPRPRAAPRGRLPHRRPSVARPPAAVPAGGSRRRSCAPPALFGAVGVRFASDLATTFTRAFPQAASADPIWTEAPFGAASTAEVTLVLDDEGHLGSNADRAARPRRRCAAGSTARWRSSAPGEPSRRTAP